MTLGLNDRDEGMNNFIPGYNESSPRTQADKLTDFVTNELHQKNLVPARIYRMADTRTVNSVKFSEILVSL